MVCSKQNEPNINISLKGNIFEYLNQFKYLGSITHNDGRSVKEIKNRIRETYKTFLFNSILISKNLNLRIRERLIKTYIWSTALYGSET